LGENTVLGQRAIDLSGKIKIQIGPMTLEQAMNLLPGQIRGYHLGQLIKRYLGPTLEFEIIFLVLVNALKNLRLGVDAISLGWACCLGQPVSEIACWPINGNNLSKN
jgi:type VI secretion system protein ImpH